MSTASITSQQSERGGRSGQPRLGRGLQSLIASNGAAESRVSAAAGKTGGDGLRQVAPDCISRNPFQPRRDFDQQALDELVSSIRMHGVLQPLLVRPVNGESGRYELIAGERRLRAAELAGLTQVPCLVRALDDRKVNEAALEENLKRDDLNVLEKAQAFRDYRERFGGTIEELAKRLSMTRSNVNNMLRLLELSEPVQQALREDRLSFGHARALLPLSPEQQAAALNAIERDGLSVRATEQLVRDLTKAADAAHTAASTSESAGGSGGKPASSPSATNHVLSLQNQLRDRLQAKVEIHQRSNQSGRIVIHFDSNDDFERLLKLLRRAA